MATIKTIGLAAAIAIPLTGPLALSAHATCWMPDHWGGLEEQLYRQCQAQEKTAEAIEDQNRLLEEQRSEQEYQRMQEDYERRQDRIRACIKDSANCY